MITAVTDSPTVFAVVPVVVVAESAFRCNQVIKPEAVRVAVIVPEVTTRAESPLFALNGTLVPVM